MWGNPLFAWNAHKKEQFRWWIQRIQIIKTLRCVRIDHFRGFESRWAVSSEDSNAINGQWEPAPGKSFFQGLKTQFPQLSIIAEDLGVITPLKALLEETGFPGMAVLQFAFSSEPKAQADNPYLPHNLKQNQVVYSGTHDNNTDWFASLDPNTKKHVQDYLKVSEKRLAGIYFGCYRFSGQLAIVPLQDLLSLGGEARFNNPGTAQGNWSWRYQWSNWHNSYPKVDYIRNQLALYNHEVEQSLGRK